MEDRTPRPRATRALCLALTALAAVLSWGCSAKEPTFFAPEFADPSSLPDRDPPRFSNFNPFTDLTEPQNLEGYSFSADDPVGSNGRPPSGLDLTSVRASLNGSVDVSLTNTDHTWSGSFSDIPDGNVDIALSASDLAGNDTTVGYSFLLKRMGPDIQFTSLPPPTQTSDQDSSEIHFSGTVIDGYIADVYGGLYDRGPNGECGDEDDVLLPKGTGPGQVSENYWEYPIDPTGGSFTASAWFYNPVEPGGSDVTSEYCLRAYAEDSAGDGMGGLNPNHTIVGASVQVSWTRAPTTGEISGTVTLDGVPWQSRVVTAGSYSGSTDAQGVYRIGDLVPGTYTVSLPGIPQDVVCDPPWGSPQVQAGQTAVVDFSCVTQPQFSIQLDPSYRHFSGYSRVCLAIVTIPAQPGASYTATVVGPSGAVSGSGVHNDTLDASGAAQVSNDIFVYATYDWTVIIGGTSASASISVTGTPGTCSF